MDEHVLPTYRRVGPVFSHGHGAVLVDESGSEYLDFLSGIGVNALGHAHPRWVEAVQDQAGQLTHVSNLFHHRYTDEVARRLAGLSGLSAVFFSNSGSEANECALKIARKAQVLRGMGERTGLVALEGGFHGRTFGSLSITANPAYREPFGPGLAATYIPPDDVAALEAALAARPAALVIEPVQGEGGLNVLSAHYLHIARKLCDESGTVFICDEVQCGAGRTGTFLASQGAGIVPDIATLAKPMASGLPFGATLVREELRDVLQPGDHGSTFGGGPLVLRAVLVVLEELGEGGLAENVRARGAELAAGLEDAVERFPIATGRRGLGLMQGLVVPGRAAELSAALFERGLITGTATGDVLRLLPPYVVTGTQVASALAIIENTLAEQFTDPLTEAPEPCKP